MVSVPARATRRGRAHRKEQNRPNCGKKKPAEVELGVVILDRPKE